METCRKKTRSACSFHSLPTVERFVDCAMRLGRGAITNGRPVDIPRTVDTRRQRGIITQLSLHPGRKQYLKKNLADAGVSVGASVGGTKTMTTFFDRGSDPFFSEGPDISWALPSSRKTATLTNPIRPPWVTHYMERSCFARVAPNPHERIIHSVSGWPQCNEREISRSGRETFTKSVDAQVIGHLRHDRAHDGGSEIHE